MATKIRLMRLGKIRTPQYRIVVADSRTKRNGKVIETIGKYHPKEDPSFIEVDSERAQYWLSVGAQPSEPVMQLLKLTGDWQTFRGHPTPSRVKVAPPKPDRKARYHAEAAAALAIKEEQENSKAKKPAKVEKTEKTEKKAVKDTAKEQPVQQESSEKPSES